MLSSQIQTISALEIWTGNSIYELKFPLWHSSITQRNTSRVICSTGLASPTQELRIEQKQNTNLNTPLRSTFAPQFKLKNTSTCNTCFQSLWRCSVHSKFILRSKRPSYTFYTSWQQSCCSESPSDGTFPDLPVLARYQRSPPREKYKTGDKSASPIAPPKSAWQTAINHCSEKPELIVLRSAPLLQGFFPQKRTDLDSNSRPHLGMDPATRPLKHQGSSGQTSTPS